MSVVLNKVKNGLSGLSNGLTNFVNSLDITESNILLLVCLIILLLGVIYLYITYLLLNNKLNNLIDYSSSVTSLGKIYSNDEYDPILFKKLLFDSLSSLKANINIITEPYFYSKNIDEILSIYPDYIKTMILTKYTFDHPDTRNDAVHKALIDKYGPSYKTNPALNGEISTNITVFRESTYDHSLLTDLTRAQIIYKKNMSRIDFILSKPKITAEESVTSKKQ